MISSVLLSRALTVSGTLTGPGGDAGRRPGSLEMHPYDIIEFYPDATLVIDGEGRVIAWNKAMEDMTGVRAEDVIGKGDFEYAMAFYGHRRPILIDLLDTPVDQVRDLYSDVRVIDGKLEAMAESARLKGSYVVLWGISSKLYDQDGKPVGAIESIRDVTRQVATEQELIAARKELERRVEERTAELARARNTLQATLDTMPAGLLMADASSGRISFATKSADDIFACEMVGINIGEGDRPYRLMKPDGTPLAVGERPLVRSLFNGERISIEELQVERADGSVVTVLLSSAPVRDEHNAVSGAVVCVMDITRRKQAEAALVEAKQQAELYLDLMSHDINNKNQIALGYLELAKESNDERNVYVVSKALDMLKSSTELIGNMRKIQQVKGGAIELERTDLGKVLSEVVEEYSEVPGRAVSIAYDPPAGYVIMANQLLKDVFANILGNAIVHSEGSLAIGIRIDRVAVGGKECCRVQVEDNGPGIPGDLKETIFGRLARGKTAARGHGLGLYLVRTLVEGFRGRVWAEDRVKGDYSQGCRFIVLLPAAKDAAADQ